MSNYLIEKYNNHSVELDARISCDERTLWLSKEQIALLFDRDRSSISRRINAITSKIEFDMKRNVRFLHVANSDKPVAFYNLTVILEVGYLIKSNEGLL